MDGLLTPVSTTYLRPRRADGALPAPAAGSAAPVSHVTSPDEALDVLKGQPDYASLAAVLRYLAAPPASDDPAAFHLHALSPKSAAIVHELVSEIVPNFWVLLQEESPHRGPASASATSSDVELMLQCLRSVTGLNAVTARIRAIVQESRLGAKEPSRPDLDLILALFLSVLDGLLSGDDAIRGTWSASVSRLPDATQKKLQSNQLAAIITSGRILSTAAEAAAVLGRDHVPPEACWIADGVEFSKWIGRNISSWTKRPGDEIELAFCADMFQRSMSLGYSGMCHSQAARHH